MHFGIISLGSIRTVERTGNGFAVSRERWNGNLQTVNVGKGRGYKLLFNAYAHNLKLCDEAWKKARAEKPWAPSMRKKIQVAKAGDFVNRYAGSELLKEAKEEADTRNWRGVVAKEVAGVTIAIGMGIALVTEVFRALEAKTGIGHAVMAKLDPEAVKDAALMDGLSIGAWVVTCCIIGIAFIVKGIWFDLPAFGRKQDMIKKLESKRDEITPKPELTS